MTAISRRRFLAGSAMAAVAGAVYPMCGQTNHEKPPFKIAVISDEISQDFDHACSVISKEFELHWVELRGMWGKNLLSLSEAELSRAETILEKYDLRVTDIASPLFKVDWPGAPQSRFSPKNDSFRADFDFKHQQEVLEQSISLAKRFKTSRVRCFDFWRLDNVKPYRAAINARLLEAANTCGQQGILLVIENEFECNTATGREAAETLAAVPSPHLMLNWDAGNAVMAGELDAFPTAWNLLPHERIGHCHCKNAVKDADGKIHWAPIGTGYIDWTAQFDALAATGYRQAVSLETHWRGAGTAEASTRISWQQMKQALQRSGTLAS
jgi:sugar phosphate isomerase/epimerase